MSLIVGVLREILGLFVEDVGYAVAILAWVGVCAIVMPFIDIPFRGLVLAGGLSAILVIGVRRGTVGH